MSVAPIRKKPKLAPVAKPARMPAPNSLAAKLDHPGFNRTRDPWRKNFVTGWRRE